MTVKNPKSIATRKCLTEALLILMKKKKIQDISISELCSKAGVSRTGFYRNFNYKEELIYEYMSYMFSDYMKEIKKRENLSTYDFAELFFSFFSNHKEFVALLIESNIQTLLLDIFTQNIEEINKQIGLGSDTTEELILKTQFLAGGLYNLLFTWVKNGCKPNIKSMANVIENSYLGANEKELPTLGLTHL